MDKSMWPTNWILKEYRIWGRETQYRAVLDNIKSLIPYANDGLFRNGSRDMKGLGLSLVPDSTLFHLPLLSLQIWNFLWNRLNHIPVKWSFYEEPKNFCLASNIGKTFVVIVNPSRNFTGSCQRIHCNGQSGAPGTKTSLYAWIYCRN